MELTEGSETSENHNLKPGKYPKEYIQYPKHGESLKSRILSNCIITHINVRFELLRDEKDKRLCSYSATVQKHNFTVGCMDMKTGL
jgi:hypothetical protein